ncbi:hypothetical protein ACOSP7_019745 [Xanthoceras sorbifolium]
MHVSLECHACNLAGLTSPVSRVSNRSCLGGSQLFPVSVKYGLPLRRYGYVSVPCSAEKKESTTKSTKFSDVLAFSGPAPERINGKLAMIGFVADMAVEISNGGIPWFVGTSVVLSLASLIPLLKGVSVESKSKGLMTSDAEMWNGGLAMLAEQLTSGDVGTAAGVLLFRVFV